MAGALDVSTRGRLAQAPPDVHVFSPRWLARHLVSGLAEVTVTVNTEAGPVTYRIDQIDQHAWRGRRAEEG